MSSLCNMGISWNKISVQLALALADDMLTLLATVDSFPEGDGLMVCTDNVHILLVSHAIFFLCYRQESRRGIHRRGSECHPIIPAVESVSRGNYTLCLVGHVFLKFGVSRPGCPPI